jgi:hypothetical protein
MKKLLLAGISAPLFLATAATSAEKMAVVETALPPHFSGVWCQRPEASGAFQWPFMGEKSKTARQAPAIAASASFACRAARVCLCDKRAVDHVRALLPACAERAKAVGRCSRSQGQSSASTAPACRRVPAPPMRLRRLDHPFPKAPSCPHPLGKSESRSAALDG